MRIDGLRSYTLGNYNLGVQLVLRNLEVADKDKYPRRYIRLIFMVLKTRTILEFRFANSI